MTDPVRAAGPGGRRWTGWALAVGGPVAVCAVVRGGSDARTTSALAYLALTVMCALVGGLWPAVVAALAGSLLLNYFATSPLHTLAVRSATDVVALGLFLVVAVSVASVVGLAARRAVQADLARREADALAMLNRALLRTGHGVDSLLGLVCTTFAATSAAVLRPGVDGGWTVVASHGQRAPREPADADAVATTSSGVTLLLGGGVLPDHDQRVLAAFATHLAVVLERTELAEQAAAASLLAQGNRLRTALLAAVSHDLRTPLAGIKAAVTTLRTPDVEWTAADRDELLGAIEESADRLSAIIANLLDLSRLQTGAVQLVRREVGLDDVVSRAVTGLPGGSGVRLLLRDDLPSVRVDAGLLDRVVANLVDNALRHGRSPVEVSGDADVDRVRLRVVDHGPGVPDTQKDSLFEPFQRLGDAPSGEGVGLGLAVARGLTEAMGGSVTAGDTAGGGLTMTVELPAVRT